MRAFRTFFGLQRRHDTHISSTSFLFTEKFVDPFIYLSCFSVMPILIMAINYTKLS